MPLLTHIKDCNVNTHIHKPQKDVKMLVQFCINSKYTNDLKPYLTKFGFNGKLIKDCYSIYDVDCIF